uniref:Ribonuclease P protein component 1 n=1 Tax=Thermofilum adornatum TaxID=1365176 RepID=A0A7C1CGD1_9CREN
MKITPRNILRHELIGLEAEVVDSTNPFQIGIRGFILDETYKTLVIGYPGRRKRRIFKSQVKLRVWLPDGQVVKIDGRYLLGRPEERLKKKLYEW